MKHQISLTTFQTLPFKKRYEYVLVLHAGNREKQREIQMIKKGDDELLDELYLEWAEMTETCEQPVC